MIEVWNRYYLIIKHKDSRMTVKVEEYKSTGGNYDREFVRIYGPNFNFKEPASQQLFGFGPTVEKAMEKFIGSMERLNARSA